MDDETDVPLRPSTASLGRVPPVQLTVIVVLASVAGVLAAIGPARRAAKLDILAAIASH